jgi:hypothetical protein
MLLREPLARALADPRSRQVRLTVIGGSVAYEAG